MQVIVDDLVINYEARGQGKVVLLLHGWGDSWQTFNQLINKLSENYYVVALDLPGFGGSQIPKDIWSLDNYASLVQHFLAKLKLNNDPYAVIGHSNGGALAIRAISLKHLEPSKLVLLAASGVRNTNNKRRAVTRLVAKTGKVTTFFLSRETKQKLRRKLYGTIGSDMLFAPHLQETFKVTVRQDVQVDAAKIDIPVLLIFADNDPAIPLSDAKRYHELMINSKLEVINSKDHFVHHDQSVKVEQLIVEFLL
jgi:pimeloyl-ACP methyl ester carboxylesterase